MNAPTVDDFPSGVRFLLDVDPEPADRWGRRHLTAYWVDGTGLAPSGVRGQRFYTDPARFENAAMWGER